MDRPRLVIIGAGLCGSILAARLRNRFAVTVVEPFRSARPVFHEIECGVGGINTSINRGGGLGGTTNYWHNALVELDEADLLAARLEPDEMRPWYRDAWQFFLDQPQREVVEAVAALQRDTALATAMQGSLAHMAVPTHRVNAWELANRRFPGDPIKVVHGRATRIRHDGGEAVVELAPGTDVTALRTDRVIVAAGGLGSPVLLARSLGRFDQVCGGYHDHPMAYVAKIRLRPDSGLRELSGVDRAGMSLRTGFVYQNWGIKAGIYLRPALGLGLRSITGEARYVLSDLRNDPFSPRKLLMLLGNPEAIREALLFKTGAGLRGDHFSLLLLGEQQPEPDRGITVPTSGRPRLDWRVTESERAAYATALEQFLSDMAPEIVASRTVPASQWEYRTAAHHSGGSASFHTGGSDPFEVTGLHNVDVCDGSMLLAGGIANSGLTLAALALRLAERLEEGEK